MSTSTDTKPNGDVADDSASNATGGDSTVTDESSKKIAQLEKQNSNLAAQSRKLQSAIELLTSKFDDVTKRLSAKDDDLELEDDEVDDDEGEDGNESKPKNSDGKSPQKAEKSSALNRALKQVTRIRKEGEAREQALISERDAWKNELAKERKTAMLEGLLRKNGVRETMMKHAVKILEGEIEHHFQEDRTLEYSHPEYGTASKFVEVFLTENPDFVANTRKSGTGDGGGADRGDGTSGGLRLPAGFDQWSKARQREWAGKLEGEQLNQYLRMVSRGGS